ncbi:MULTISPECIES: ZPR1 zinc finger domain-containing protein [Methanothermococcus]|jgi:zinc finger protein|uniref:ZPR1 zinc finger domain-containing protein n=1 Tax=Methanothermococcus TaxID=155862 RepID=UPI000364E663|nr:MULTISPECIES: ZPR1 zinc finger domain-containing protein [Methanothermococcus]
MEQKMTGVLDCPICGSKNSMRIITNELEIPYFGNVVETTMICDSCKYKKSDIFPTEVKEPKRYILKIQSEDDLNKRVIRAATGYVTIPELGFEVSPGPVSEGYVSNVEGVLNRLESALETLISWLEDENEKSKAEELFERIEKVKEGKESVTLIIEDPLGHSAIIGDGVKEELLTDEEVEKLKGNVLIIDKDAVKKVEEN